MTVGKLSQETEAFLAKIAKVRELQDELNQCTKTKPDPEGVWEKKLINAMRSLNDETTTDAMTSQKTVVQSSTNHTPTGEVHHKSVVADLAHFLEVFRATQTIVERSRMIMLVERGIPFPPTSASPKELEVIRCHRAAMRFFVELQLILFGRHSDQSHHQKINEVLTLDQAAQAIEAAKFFLECDMFVWAASKSVSGYGSNTISGDIRDMPAGVAPFSSDT